MNRLATHRGPAPHSERPSRELPVLFHLMDVSRQRPIVPAPEALAPAAVTLTPPVELPPPAPPIAEPIAELPAVELPLAPPPPPEPVAISQPPAAETPAVTKPASTAPVQFSLDRPIELCVAPSEAAIETTVAQPGEESPNHFTKSQEPNAGIEHPVSPRPPFEARRKFRMPLSEDWFAAHGRYIAVVFVIALIGTIYLARTNRRPAKALAASTQAAAAAQNGPSSALEAPAIVLNGAPAISSAPSAPPKLVDTASATSDARTELHPPTATEVTSKTATESNSASADNLFVFPQAKKAEERVAARPDSPQPIVNPTVAAPGPSPASAPSPAAAGMTFTPPAAPAMPTAPAPSLPPAYPTTSMPPVNYPTTSPPQHAYPTTAAPPLAEAPGPAMPPRVPPGQPAPHQPVYPPTNSFQPPVNPGVPAWQPPATHMPAAQVPPAAGTLPPNTQGAWAPPAQGALPPNAQGAWTPPAQGTVPPTAQGAWTPSTPGGWSPPAPGGMPPQYQSPDNTARGFRNERTGSSLY